MTNIQLFRPTSFLSDDFFKRFFDTSLSGSYGSYSNITMYDKDGKTYLEVAMPGFNKDDIKVDIQDGAITISAENKIVEEDDSGKKYYYKMAQSQSYSQTIALPHDVDEESVLAKYDNGCLKIEMKHSAQKQAKQITIN